MKVFVSSTFSDLVAEAKRFYDAIRSATGINCPDPIRAAASELLPQLKREPDHIILDALCTGDTDLPVLTSAFNAGTWDLPIRELMQEAHDALLETPKESARTELLIAELKLGKAFKLEPKGFARLVGTFADDTEFIALLADQLIAEQKADDFATQLSATLNVLHSNASEEFHRRANAIFVTKNLLHVRAAAAALRVYSDNATLEDVAQIKKYLSFPDNWVKYVTLQAIAYMGKNIQMRQPLLDAALSVEVNNDPHVAASLADAFGTYGIPLSLLKRQDVAKLLFEFSGVEDLDADQGKLPNFLTELVTLFPDAVVEFLISRIAIERQARADHNWGYRTFRLIHGNVSFEALKPSDRLTLASKCLDSYLLSDNDADSHAALFWMISGPHDEVLDLLVTACDSNDSGRIEKLAMLIRYSPRKLVFGRPQFAQSLLGKVSVSNREKLTDAFVGNAHSSFAGTFSVGPVDPLNEHSKRIADQVAALPTDGALAELVEVLKRSIVSTHE